MKHLPSSPDIHSLTMPIFVQYLRHNIPYTACKRVQLFLRRMEVFGTRKYRNLVKERISEKFLNIHSKIHNDNTASWVCGLVEDVVRSEEGNHEGRTGDNHDCT